MPPSSQYTHSRGPPPTGCIRAAHKPTARSVRLRTHAPPCAALVCFDLLAFIQDPARPVCPTAATRRQDPDGASRAGSHLLILHTGTAVQRSFHVGLWYQAERPRCACAWRPCGRGRVCASRPANAKCRWCNLYCSAAWCLSCSAASCKSALQYCSRALTVGSEQALVAPLNRSQLAFNSNNNTWKGKP
jgi:hypothetical protein